MDGKKDRPSYCGASLFFVAVLTWISRSAWPSPLGSHPCAQSYQLRFWITNGRSDMPSAPLTEASKFSQADRWPGQCCTRFPAIWVRSEGKVAQCIGDELVGSWTGLGRFPFHSWRPPDLRLHGCSIIHQKDKFNLINEIK